PQTPDIPDPNSGVVPFDTIQKMTVFQQGKAVVGASVGRIGMPFIGEHQITLAFGEQLLDAQEKDLYANFGLPGHDGMDFGMPDGTTIVAVDDGTVIHAGPQPYGTTIIIQHSWGES